MIDLEFDLFDLFRYKLMFCLNSIQFNYCDC